MSYTRKWIPPTIPLRNDLDAWKTLFQDVHDSLILAGLVQTDTPGQLVIQDVESLPADGTFAGFIEYAFDDELQAEAPVVIRLEYGCGTEGLYTSNAWQNYVRSRTPRIRSQVSLSGVTGSSFGHPQTFNYSHSATNTSQLTHFGTSYIHYDKEKGFLGIVYGAGSRNKPWANNAGSYYGSSLSLFVQRDLTSSGIPTSEGVAVICPDLQGDGTANLWTSGILPRSLSQFITADGASQPLANMALRVGGTNFGIFNGKINIQQAYYTHPTEGFKPFPFIVTYVNENVIEGTEFELEVFPGTSTTFVALGNETSLSADSISGQRIAFAMKFE